MVGPRINLVVSIILSVYKYVCVIAIPTILFSPCMNVFSIAIDVMLDFCIILRMLVSVNKLLKGTRR